MLIVIDEDIANGLEVFGRLGEVRTVAGRAMRAVDLAKADALVVRSVTRVDATLLVGSSVRFVGTVTTGVDHVDTAWLANQGIALVSAAGCNSVPVAEYMLAATLLLARRLKFDPADKTLGVLGVGRIGSIVGRWGEALGMKVLRCDPPLERQLSAVGNQPSAVSDQPSASWCENPLSRQAEYVSFEQLAAAADIVTLHVPLTHEGPDRTCGMADAKWLEALKTGAILINTSRGDVVCEDDLAVAIDAGRLAAVVLDVWRNEPAIDADLVRRVNVATPHIAGYSVESRWRAVGMIFDALAALVRGPSAPARESPARESLLAPTLMSISSRALPPVQDSPNDIAVSRGEPWLPTVTDAVLRACDLEAVDGKLRAGLGTSVAFEAFDDLRRQCAGRREFGAYRVRGVGEHEPARRFLAEVGFAD